MRDSGNGIARATRVDAADEYARCVVGQRTMRVLGVPKDVDDINRFRQIFARMPGFPSNFYVKSHIGSAARYDRARLEGVIKYNAIAHLPGRWIERACAN